MNRKELVVMKRYTDDYETVVTKDEKGNEKEMAMYRGKYFEIMLDEKSFVRFKRNCLLLLAAIVVLHISGGFVANPGMYQLYVALPYVLAFFPLLFMAMGIFRLPKEKRKYRRDEMELSFNRLKTSSIILIILLGTGVLGELAYLFFFSNGIRTVLETVYLVIEAFTIAAVYFIIVLQRQIHVHPCAEQ
jgi:amino acid transporter